MITSGDSQRFEGLDPNDQATTTLLDSVQAGILKSHGRDFVAYLFITWNLALLNRIQVGKWLHSLKVTSAAQQLEQIKNYKTLLIEDSVILSVMLSIFAYKALKIPARLIPREVAFRDGMKTSMLRLGERGTVNWDPFYKSSPHCCIQIACSDQQKLEQKIADQQDSVSFYFGEGAEVHIERGEMLRNSQGEVIEHFGFRDGISQPLFFKDQIESQSSHIYDNSYDPHDIVLVSEAPITSSFGSYCVYRKIEQNMSIFKKLESELSQAIGASEKLAGSLAMGRFPEGDPTVKVMSGDINSFTFADDLDGMQCPLHSHIRKSNPRIPAEDVRIVRRGIPYGNSNKTSTCGLLFFCFQRDISTQFEKIQGAWLNSPRSSESPIKMVGQDGISGLWDLQNSLNQQWPQPWPSPISKIKFSFGNVTTIKGGEYFYTPSIKMLQLIASNLDDTNND
ncbi:Dyp-type peroxidase family [Pseudomonas sp. TE36184]